MPTNYHLANKHHALILALGLMVVLASCTSTQGELLDAMDSPDAGVFRSMEDRIKAMELGGPRDELATIRGYLREKEGRLAQDPGIYAWTLGLLAWLGYIEEKPQEVQRYVEILSRRRPDSAWTIHSKVLSLGKTKLEEALEIIQGAPENVDRPDLLDYRRALILKSLGRSSEALLALDESLMGREGDLDSEALALREETLTITMADLKNTQEIDILRLPSLSFEQWYGLLTKETALFTFLGMEGETAQEALQRLKNGGYLRADLMAIQQEVQRRDLATLLFWTYQGTKNDTFIKSRLQALQTAISLGTRVPSAIRDMDTKDPGYLPAVVMVERGILELPDGEGFGPNLPAKALESLEAARKLMGQIGNLRAPRPGRVTTP